jgi:hypothetical protein
VVKTAKNFEPQIAWMSADKHMVGAPARVSVEAFRSYPRNPRLESTTETKGKL